MILILGECFLAIKLNLIDHTHIRFVSKEKGAVGKIAKPGAVPPTARVSTFAIAKSTCLITVVTIDLSGDPETLTCTEDM